MACLGVTQEDWTALGQAALMHLELDTARKAFIRTQDLLMLNLVHRLELLVKSGVVADVLKGELLAYQVRSCCLCASLVHSLAVYLIGCNRGSACDALTGVSVPCLLSVLQGRYDDASSLFGKAKANERIIEMWTDLRQFDKATKWAQSSGRGSAAVDALRMQQAQWNEEVRDFKSAAEMYLDSGQGERAVALLASNLTEWTYLLDVTRRLDRCSPAP